VAYNPDDYDEVYETISASDKTQLLRQGWVLLDERFASEGGLADESFAKTVAHIALGYRGGQGIWSGAAREQPEPEPPHTVTTYVLGWPKGQQTISEDDADAYPSGSAAAQPVTERSPDAGPAVDASSQPDVPDAESAPDGSEDPASSDVPDAPTPPSPPREVGGY
jgi:hypothetical protein